MEQTGSNGRKIHQELHTWVAFGNAKYARTILEALLKTHGSSLNDENLRTLITETEAIINSRPLTVETLSDVNSEMPLSPSHLLTMKTDVILLF